MLRNFRVPTHLEKPGNTWKPEKTWKKLLFLLQTWKMGVEVSSRNDKNLEKPGNFFWLSKITFFITKFK